MSTELRERIEAFNNRSMVHIHQTRQLLIQLRSSSSDDRQTSMVIDTIEALLVKVERRQKLLYDACVTLSFLHSHAGRQLERTLAEFERDLPFSEQVEL